jgi:hypothetical protein
MSYQIGGRVSVNFAAFLALVEKRHRQIACQ